MESIWMQMVSEKEQMINHFVTKCFLKRVLDVTLISQALHSSLVWFNGNLKNWVINPSALIIETETIIGYQWTNTANTLSLKWTTREVVEVILLSISSCLNSVKPEEYLFCNKTEITKLMEGCLSWRGVGRLLSWPLTVGDSFTIYSPAYQHGSCHCLIRVDTLLGPSIPGIRG